MKKIILVVLSSLLCLSSAFEASARDVSRAPTPAEVLVYINQYRASQKLPPLVMNAALTKEAIAHSQDMANHKVGFGHTGFYQRIRHLHHDVDNLKGGAENVAYNYNTARIVVDGWIKSPGHRRNIVGRYNLTGIGIVRDSAGKLYYTQLFARTEKKPAAHAHQTNKHARPRFFIG